MSNNTQEILYHTKEIKESEQNITSSGSFASLLDLSNLFSLLPKRKKLANKGDFGHVLVVGGDFGMGGAVSMAGEAALRVGAGLVSIATREEHVVSINAKRPELMCHGILNARQLKPLLTKATVIVIGPGLGRSRWGKNLLFAVLKSELPKIIDADALNLLTEKVSHAIYTPHPGEAARMLKISITEVQDNRLDAINKLQQKFGGIFVLKGFESLVKGNDDKISLCSFGNPGMASGGMGDILSGIIAGLAAQGLPLQKAAEMGVCLHAVAGDLAAKEFGERGLLATDLFPYVRKLVNENK